MHLFAKMLNIISFFEYVNCILWGVCVYIYDVNSGAGEKM